MAKLPKAYLDEMYVKVSADKVQRFSDLAIGQSFYLVFPPSEQCSYFRRFRNSQGSKKISNAERRNCEGGTFVLPEQLVIPI